VSPPQRALDHQHAEIQNNRMLIDPQRLGLLVAAAGSAIGVGSGGGGLPAGAGAQLLSAGPGLSE